MADIIQLDEFRQARRARKLKPKSGLKSKKLGKSRKGVKWSFFKTGTLSIPLAKEMMRAPQYAAPAMQDRPAVLESGVLAFRRERNGDPCILLISRKRSKKWGIPKGKVEPTLTFPETAAKEAFEEAGVIGYISPYSVGMFRAKKRTGNRIQQTIEVWVYLLEVIETAPDWPERGKRATRWVTCEAAARHLREPVLTHLCHRLAQS
jgi:8-oxo-dGTP pyrophosphatase MutT (NUDIX family)